jgi:hypothetical protein
MRVVYNIPWKARAADPEWAMRVVAIPEGPIDSFRIWRARGRWSYTGLGVRVFVLDEPLPAWARRES